MFDTTLKKKRAAGLLLLAVLLTLFLVFNRLPKLETVQADLAIAASPKTECFQGFCIESSPDTTLWSRWWDFSVTYLRLVTVGMIFAFLVAGLTEAFLFPQTIGRTFADRGIKGSLKGLIVGPAMNLCSACIVPVASAFRRKGAGIEATLAITQGSSTLNLPAIIMAAMVFTPLIGGTRIALSLAGALLIGPFVAFVVGRGAERDVEAEESEHTHRSVPSTSTWREALVPASIDWLRASFGYLIRLGPIMVLAGFASGFAIQWVSPDTVTTWLGNDLTGIALAATLGILINVPLLFEIPLVAALLLAGMGVAPAATLLFVAAAGGPITFWGLAKVMSRKAIFTFGTATWTLGLAGGLVVLLFNPLVDVSDGLRSGVGSAQADVSASLTKTAGAPPPGPVVISSRRLASPYLTEAPADPVAPFVNVAKTALKGRNESFNVRPGVATFDFDRDGDMDFYVSNAFGLPAWLYRNEGDGTFVDIGGAAGVGASGRNSTGVAACDFNNDGYQDLYVGAQGSIVDRLDFRSSVEGEQNKDQLFLNNGDGTFTDITAQAFGDAVNIRSAMSVICADVDGDGWLDIYVGNLAGDEFRRLDVPFQGGHYNVLYRNTGDLTFDEVAEAAGVRGPQIVLRDPNGQPILYTDPETGVVYEGYDPTIEDESGNRVGDPTGQTHAVMFFDYDDDGDPDLWLANDGDRLHVFRNDSSPGNIRFTPIERSMGIDRVGSWMGFALGDYDGDADLDVFVTNIGFHSLTRPAFETPGASCEYHERFAWGTCSHLLLKNEGVRFVPGLGTVGVFHDVASSTAVIPSPLLPPDSLDPANIHPTQEVPTGLSAYDFGFGATFFDYDNDGDQDLYWLGSTVDRGEAPGGEVFPAAGRMLRSDGEGGFEDITVRARLLDIERVLYERIDDPEIGWRTHRASPEFHENGKGLAHGDLNGDGFLDLIGTNSLGALYEGGSSGSFSTAPGPLFVWMNPGGDNHWLTLRLQGRMGIDGTGSNADGVGARVYLKSGDDPLVQVQEVQAGSPYLSMNSVELEFGLGEADVAEEITILWPSGRTQTLKNVEADRVLVVVEPEG